jgi:hypothetical protein
MIFQTGGQEQPRGSLNKGHLSDAWEVTRLSATRPAGVRRSENRRGSFTLRLRTPSRRRRIILSRGRAERADPQSILLLAPVSAHPSLDTLKKIDHEFALRPELRQFLRIALGLAALPKLHQRQLIHKDVKPWRRRTANSWRNTTISRSLNSVDRNSRKISCRAR